MRSTPSEVGAPQWAFAIPLVLAIPYVSVVVLAFVLNRGR